MVLSAAVLWGSSGTLAQYLFHEEGIEFGWLVMVRLLISGFLLLMMAYVQSGRKKVLSLWKDSVDKKQIIILGIAGMVGTQYTFFASIEAGNAATATLLQYLGPALLTVWIAFRLRRMPRAGEWMAVGFALIGTFFLVTGGNPSTLSISLPALLWGLASAVGLAFYTLYPSRLLNQWGAGMIVGWAMFIGGLALMFIHPPWSVDLAGWELKTYVWIAVVVFLGTLLPFFLYLDSLRYLRPSETALLSCAEPLTAAIVAVWWLGVPFGFPEWLGASFIIGTVVLLSLMEEHSKSEVPVSDNSKKPFCKENGQGIEGSMDV
nr:EamA family transporter [Melghirimyces algeriensis]